MDCLEFRRLLGSDPHVGDPAAREHAQSCPFCAEAQARAQAFEARLAVALAVPVPSGLADRVLLAQLTRERRERRGGRSRLGWLALTAAAGLVLAIGLWPRHEAPGLAQLVAEHVMAPAEHAALSRTAPLPEADVRRAFAERGLALASVPAGIAYARDCPVGPYRTVHMVMHRADDPVSVVYVVQYRVPVRRDFEREGLHGREVPIRDGTLVMLARSDDRFGPIERDWEAALDGSTGLTAAGAP